MTKTKEPQYQVCLDIADEHGFARFGLMSNQTWREDPKRLTFLLSRYKFVAKMFSGRQSVLEVGCADAFATRIVRREVENLSACDFDSIFIADAEDAADPDWPITFFTHDMLAAPVPGTYDGIYSLDVLEHIRPEHEDTFIRHLVAGLHGDGAAIIGMPSLESQAHASEASKAGHVNCKTGPDFRRLMERYFANVFLFSMNDEVVHTGFTPMAHYLIALCCTPRADA